jgi:methylphosphonate synthase
MSKLAPFKPEWIKELRVVKDSNPDNLDVAYNNGHFMHQMTFFVGCVNFYYEIDGKKYCEEMTTGDSNYISPYLPHTFTSRDETQEAYILAITFGGDVRRAQKELYALGSDNIIKYKLDMKNENKAVSQLILQNMKNENLTKEMLKNENIDIDNLLDETKEKSSTKIEQIASILNIEPCDLTIPKYKKEHEIVICKKDNEKEIFYPSKDNKIYKIHNLARANKLPNVKGFNVEILSNDIQEEDMFETSLHSYIYNYTNAKIEIIWIHNNKQFSKILQNGDSIYIQPFIKHGFKNDLGIKSALCISRVSGSMNICTQKELSYFNDISRVANENQCWFN